MRSDLKLEELTVEQCQTLGGGDAWAVSWGVMMGLGFVAGATGVGVALWGAFAVGALLAASDPWSWGE